MTRTLNGPGTRLRNAARILVISIAFAGTAAATSSPVDEGELVKFGFKTLVAATDVQRQWVRNLPPGKIRAMQRTGKKYFIYPDASRDQIYVGGPAEYNAYTKAHPEELANAQRVKDEAAKESARRGKEAKSMQAATARDLSDPFLGATWAELGW